MAEIKSIGPNEFESYINYLMFFKDVLNFIDEPTSIKIDGREYVVARENRILSVAFDNGERLEGYGIILDDEGNMISLIDQEYIYELFLKGSSPLVSRTAINTDAYEQLHINSEDDNKYRNLVYYCKTYDSSHELETVYDMSFFSGEVGTFLDYNGSRLPKGVFLNHFKKFVGPMKRVKKDWYLQLHDEDVYAKMLIHFDFPVVPVSTFKIYTFEDLKDYLAEFGLSCSIPDDLKDLLAGRSEKAKTLEKVSHIYCDYLR